MNDPVLQAEALLRQGQPEPARALLRGAVATDPRNARAWLLLTDALLRLGQPIRAQAACREALRLQPTGAIHSLLATALLAENNPDRLAEAEHHLQEALKLDATLGDALANLAQMRMRQGRIGEAETLTRRALERMPDSAVLLGLLGHVLLAQWRLEEGLAHMHRALERSPSDARLHSTILWYETCVDRPTQADHLQAHRRWVELHTKDLPVFDSHANSPDPERTLTIGFPASDFRAHPMATFLSALFQHHDPQHLRLIAYADVRTPDMFTDMFKRWADGWIDSSGMSDDALAARIRADGVDILIERMAHMEGHRLRLFARKPVPIQVAYTGYDETRGMDTIDYWLTDRLLNPSETAAAFVEQFWCLPCARSYTPPLLKAEVPPPPSTVISGPGEGRITFGSFNRAFKISPRCLPVWARVLQAVPNSRLLLRGTGLEYPEAHEYLRDQFAAQGVAPERIVCEPFSAKHEYLQDFSRIDIALDPFPHNGVTTTLDTLWMGVPVVALAGDTTLSRYGLALLTHAGHPEWIAATPEEYVAIAAGLAADPQHLIALRRKVRADLLASPLCDGPGFTRAFEDAMRGMWRKWCTQRQ